MKYSDAVNTMVKDPTSGFKHIQGKGKKFQAEVINEIIKNKCSFPTAHVFISFVENRIEKGKKFELKDVMLESAIFITSGMGFDFNRYSEEITNLDIAEVKKITSGNTVGK